MNNNSLKINQNKDGTFTVEWDTQDPVWSWMNNLTSKKTIQSGKIYEIVI